MNRYPSYQPLHPPTGPAAMILPSVILGPLGLLALGGGQEAMQSSVVLGSLYCAGGLAIFAFLAFCLACWRALKTDPGCALNFDPPGVRG